jgi:hypothetical protein
MALLAALSDPLIALLGAEWASASAVLKVVVILGMTKAVVLFNAPLLFALSRPRTAARLIWAVGLTTACGIVMTGTLMRTAVVEYQIITVAAVRVAIFTIPYVIACLIITRRLCGIPVRQLTAAIAPGIGAGLAAVAVAAALAQVRTIADLPAIAELAAIGLPASIAAAGALLLFDAPLRRALAGALSGPAALGARWRGSSRHTRTFRLGSMIRRGEPTTTAEQP